MQMSPVSALSEFRASDVRLCQSRLCFSCVSISAPKAPHSAERDAGRVISAAPAGQELVPDELWFLPGALLDFKQSIII